MLMCTIETEKSEVKQRVTISGTAVVFGTARWQEGLSLGRGRGLNIAGRLVFPKGKDMSDSLPSKKPELWAWTEVKPRMR